VSQFGRAIEAENPHHSWNHPFEVRNHGAWRIRRHLRRPRPDHGTRQFLCWWRDAENELLHERNAGPAGTGRRPQQIPARLNWSPALPRKHRSGGKLESYHYSESGDGVAWSQTGVGTFSRYIFGINGELAATAETAGSSTTVQLQLSNLHGDVVASASPDSSVASLLGTFEFDEYGNPKQSGMQRFGWVGGKAQRTELKSSVIQMGVRSYVPALGRFLTPDPILGGSANAYEYASGDPVNNFDLTGEKICTQVHGAWACGADPASHRRARQRLERQYNQEASTARRASGTKKAIVLMAKGG
jgi:RHS repeat-associated protein